MTWQEVAAEIGGGYTASSLAGLARGGAMGFPAVMRVFGWIRRPVKEFVRFEPDDGE
jgi:hypothetical protein